MTSKQPQYFGFYSPSAAQQHGYTLYTRPDGSEVRVTCATTDPQGSAYWWTDKEPVGPICEFIRAVDKPSRNWPW